MRHGNDKQETRETASVHEKISCQRTPVTVSGPLGKEVVLLSSSFRKDTDYRGEGAGGVRAIMSFFFWTKAVEGGGGGGGGQPRLDEKNTCAT